MKPVSLAFLVLLVQAHTVGDMEKLLARPLSEFRDGDQAWIGYVLFALLILIAERMITAAVHLRREVEIAVFCLAGFLLAVVALTPSFNGLHNLCALLLLLFLYAYFAGLLYHSASLWLIPHLVVPAALLLAVRCHSYGYWQKSLIVYFLLVINFHYHTLRRGMPSQKPSARPQTEQTVYGGKRKVVYLVSPTRSWPVRVRKA